MLERFIYLLGEFKVDHEALYFYFYEQKKLSTFTLLVIIYKYLSSLNTGKF